MLTRDDIDWNRRWREDRKTASKAHDLEFWNKRAPSFAKHVQQDDGDDYVEPFLRVLDAQPDWSVLDVGCGNGAIACPLAGSVRHVTALDFSPAMLALLEARKGAEGIDNITTLLARWEDDWTALGIQTHDVAVASRSLISEDPRTILMKLASFARKRVYVSVIAGDGPGDRRLLQAVGRETSINPDYIYIYSLLHQMGIYANVSMIEKKLPSFSGEDEAVESMRWMLDEMTPTEEDSMRRFISAHLVRDGQRWKLDYRRPVRWAVIWWNVTPQP
jgi:SAM-dependent methyltransferase